MRAILTAIFVCVATVASAQMFPITVLPDRVVIGSSQFIPRCATVTGNLLVLAGQTRTLADGETFSCVEVQSGGLLRADRTKSTTVKITTLIVLPGGTLDEGMASDPIPATVTYTRVARNVPIDTTKDPFQWGNGLVNFGTHTAVGSMRTAFVSLAVDAQAGATTLTLASAPVGWRTGDEVLLPDAELNAFQFGQRPKRETKATIVSLVGTTLVLSKGLDFAHHTIVRPDNNSTAVVAPIVANLTRNVNFTSENPAGTRGHQADIGDGACWDVEGTKTLGMGRTTTAPVDNTSSDGVTHIGTNVNAKYAVHFHHVGMACPSARTFSDNVVQGIGTGKWGVDVHGTYDTILADNVVLDFPGAGFITEDGYEVRNHFSRNLAMYNLNTTGVTSATDDIRTNQPGTEGTGFWLHGIMQYLDGNQVWDNTVGINLLAVFMTVPGSYPSSPGVMPDIPLGPFDSPSFQPFLSLTGNTVVGSGVIGFEAWGVKRAPADQNIFANNYVGFLSAQADNDPWFRTNNLFVNTNIPLNGSVPLDQLYNWGRCIQLASGYVAHFQMDSGYIGGCGIGIQGIPIDGFVVSNVTFKNPVDVNFDHGVPPGSVFSGDTFIVYGQYPPIFYLQYGTDVLWNGTGPNPLDGGPPPPPPPPPTWVTLSGIFQQQTTPDPTQFRLCPDATGMNCQAFVKP